MNDALYATPYEEAVFYLLKKKTASVASLPRGLASVKTHVAAPGSTNSERLTAKPAREGFVVICEGTMPTGAGSGTVCVERGRRQWPITMLTDTIRRKRAQRKQKEKHLTRPA